MDVKRTTFIAATLLLVLLLGESLALCDDKVGVSTVGVIVGHIGVASELRIDVCIGFDALESVLNMVLLGLGCIFRG